MIYLRTIRIIRTYGVRIGRPPAQTRRLCKVRGVRRYVYNRAAEKMLADSTPTKFNLGKRPGARGQETKLRQSVEHRFQNAAVRQARAAAGVSGDMEFHPRNLDFHTAAEYEDRPEENGPKSVFLPGFL